MIGTSWGGLDAVSRLLDAMHSDVHQPIVVAQHRGSDTEEGMLAHLLQSHTRRVVSDRPITTSSSRTGTSPSRPTHR